MKAASVLRQYYVPHQPILGPGGDAPSYCEFGPAPALRNWIYCYWRLQTTIPLAAPFVYRVVADGCIDVFWDLHHPQESFVMGFCKKFTEFSLGKSFDYVGVRFLPTMFPQLCRVDAAELSDRLVPLEGVVPATAHFLGSRFAPDLGQAVIQGALDAHFATLVDRARPDDDPRLYRAIGLIMAQPGLANLQTRLDTGLSPRQLRRLFARYVGDTPKTFSQVVRFQQLLRANPSAQSLRQHKVFFEMGYYDQAHFIKEFKGFYGLTPGQAFGG